MPIDSRLLEISQFASNPPPVAAPPSESSETIETPVPNVAEIEVAVGGLPPTVESSNSFRFVQEDELEASEELQQSQTSDWVQVSEAEPEEHVEVTETTTVAEVNGHTIVEETVTVTTTSEVRFHSGS